MDYDAVRATEGFMLCPGHDDPHVEHVIADAGSYIVVETDGLFFTVGGVIAALAHLVDLAGRTSGDRPQSRRHQQLLDLPRWN